MSGAVQHGMSTSANNGSDASLSDVRGIEVAVGIN